MSEQPTAWPEWAPDDLVLRYQERSTEEDRRLKRLLTDPRMEKVWSAIRKRTENPSYPTQLWITIGLFLSPGNPKKSPNALQKQHSVLSHHLRKVLEHLPESAIAENAKILIEMEKRASDVAEHIHSWLAVYTNHLKRTVEYPQRTLLARCLTAAFKRDLKTPLWNPTALLIEVALDLPEGTVSGQWVKSTCDDRSLPD
jgi:hypothetical protein